METPSTVIEPFGDVATVSMAASTAAMTALHDDARSGDARTYISPSSTTWTHPPTVRKAA